MIHDLLALALSVASLSAVPAHPTPVKVGTPPARMELLKPGVHRYLRYTVQDGRRSAMDIWSRTVALERQDGAMRLHLTQEWDRDLPPESTVKQDAWFDAKTFAPLTHVRRAEKGGTVTISGYRFAPDQIVGLADLPDNTRKDFSLKSPEPAFNFEYDMELLQVLPWAPGYAADLMFYDPGFDPPAHYVFRLAGEDRIAGPDGRPIDCWVVTADYNTGKVMTRFWLAKGSQVVVHEEAEANGKVLVMTLLGAEAADSAPIAHASAD